MASRALTGWCTDSAGKLDELIAAHASVVHAGRGRQYATAQINASLVVQVAAHFQLFCRNLHSTMVMYREDMASEKQEFVPGMKVGVRFSGEVTPAVVTEDRGIFGGHRIVRVRLDDPDNLGELEFEVPADEFEPLPAAA